MLNVSHTLERMEISQTSVSKAIRSVGEILENSEDQCRAAKKFVKSLLSLDTEFKDANLARITAFAVIEAVVKVNGVIDDEEELLASATARAVKHINAPANAWMYTTPEQENSRIVETKAVAAGVDTKVAVKADGSIVRGGKSVLAAALFDLHVLNSKTPCDNACFVKVLQKELGMSLAGARTYAHSLRSQHGLVQHKVK
jgi:hypothetical protein